jgi:hypothetical protein
VIAKHSSSTLPVGDSDDPGTSTRYLPLDTEVLLLWDNDEQEMSGDMACDFVDAGHRVFDLSNGMTPIVISPPPGETLKKVPNPVEDKIKPLTEEDIESMPKSVRNQFDRGVSEVESVVEDTDDTPPHPRHSGMLEKEAIVVYTVIYPDGTLATGTEKMSVDNAMSLLPEAY